MINNISTGLLSSRYPQKISFFPKNSSKKKIKLFLNNKLRNKSTNIPNFATTLLPNLNNNNFDNNKYIEDNLNDNKTFKNSFASTFYSTKSNMQNTMYDNTNNKFKINNNMLNHFLGKTKSFSKKKKIQIDPKIFDIKTLKKNKKSENLNIEHNDTLNSKENDYSLVIKKLDRWDQDNCFLKQYDKFSLYKILNDYYKKKGLAEDLENLNTMDSLLKSKSNYDRLIKNRLNYKNSKIATENMYSPHNKNKTLNVGYKLNNNNSNKNLKKKDNEEYKLLTEKIKYESQLHNDLVFVNNIIYNKKCLKKDVVKKYEEVYKKKSQIKYEYDKKYNNLMKDYWSTYDEYDQRYKRYEELYIQQTKMEKLEKKEEAKENNADVKKENDVNDENKKEEDEKEYKDGENQENSNSDTRRHTIKKDDFIKEMQFIKNIKLNSINLVLKKNLDKLKLEYKDKFKDINKQEKDLEEKIKIISKELNYYKQVNDELVREHRTYYMSLLKKGTDSRKDGLVWIVKNLLELQVNLEYQHFPKFLTHEHIDYLIKLAHLLLEQSELVIIIKILRKRQTTYYMDDNMQTYKMLDKFMEEHFKEKNGNKDKKDHKNNNVFIIGNVHQRISENYGTKMMDIIQEIDKKFYKVYKNNKEMMKNYLEKNEEELKLRNALEHIKQGLYNSDKYVKDNQKSILDAFLCNNKNKDFFSFILKIKNRLNQLDQIIDNLIKNEKDIYIEQSKKISNSNNNNYDNNINSIYNKDIIKKSLFGEKCDF